MVSLLLLGLAIAGGTALTIWLEPDAPLWARWVSGVPIGLVLLGLVGYVLGSVFGLRPAVPFLAAGLTAVPVLALAFPGIRRRAGVSRPPGESSPRLTRCAVVVSLSLLGLLLFRVYDRAAIVGPQGIATGVDHNLGDLPFHLGIVMGFVRGDAFPPEHPELAGVRLTYPFLVDLITALLVTGGEELGFALWAPGFVLAVALILLVYRFTSLLTRSSTAAALAPWLLILSGGAGFVLLGKDLEQSSGLLRLLTALPRNYTIASTGELRWGNALTTLFVPQRALLLGLPLTLVVLGALWQAVRGDGESEMRRVQRMGAAGVVAGLLPLGHLHSYAVLMATACFLAVLFRPRRWIPFFVAALVVGVPQVIWLVHGGSLEAQSFLAWQFGWDRGDRNPVLFWLFNTGLFLPLLASAWCWGRRLVEPAVLRFLAPFALWFVAPNLLRLSPWIWDNVKFLIYWYVASVPLVAALLARLAQKGLPGKAGAGLAFVVLVLAGALDVGRVASGATEYGIFDTAGVAVARDIALRTEPGALVLRAPTFNSPVLLSGRRSLLGYPGHIWSQGLEAGQREQEIRRMYASSGNDVSLLHQHGVDYVLIGPHEASLGPVNEPFFATFPKVLEEGPYRLYRVTSP